MFGGVRLGGGEQLGGLNSEGARQLQQVAEAYVALTAFDAADIRAVQVGALRERLLGDTEFSAPIPNRASERLMFG